MSGAAAVKAVAERALDVARVRAELPILAQQVHGRPLVYLDSAASSQRPLSVLRAVEHYETTLHSNVHRGVHALSQAATAAYEGARETVRAHLNARSSREIVFVRGATEAINLVANSWGRSQLKPGDEVLITQLEHHANIVPWQLACAATGARLRAAPVLATGELDLQAFTALLTERTRLVAVAHVSNALGTILPVREIVQLAHARGIPVLLDGAQAAPHEAVDVQALDCDFYVLSGHKVYAPTGIGVLYGREALLAAMPPWQGGGDMILTVSIERSTYNELPWKFEAGTPNISGAIGLAAAFDYINALGLDAIAAHEQALLTLASARLAALPGVRLIGTAPAKSAIVSFVMDGVHPHDIGTILDSEGIAIRTGHHCAMPIMEFYGLAATARASFACYNTREEVLRLVEGLQTVRELLADAAHHEHCMELKDLYRDVILDHNRSPRNRGRLEPADAQADGHNPLCGDRLTVSVRLEGDRVADVRFDGQGCAISVASASLMTEAIKGHSRAEIQALFEQVHTLLTDHAHPPSQDLGKLQALGGVAEFPARVKCASLCWHTLNAALERSARPVSTE